MCEQQYRTALRLVQWLNVSGTAARFGIGFNAEHIPPYYNKENWVVIAIFIVCGLGTPVENPGPMQLLTVKLYKFGIKKAARAIRQRYPETMFHIIGEFDDEAYLLTLKLSEQEGVIRYHGQ